jgi:hypothetical protein
MEMPKSTRNIEKYADNVMNVMRENAHIKSHSGSFNSKIGNRFKKVLTIDSNHCGYYK